MQSIKAMGRLLLVLLDHQGTRVPKITGEVAMGWRGRGVVGPPLGSGGPEAPLPVRSKLRGPEPVRGFRRRRARGPSTVAMVPSIFFHSVPTPFKNRPLSRPPDDKKEEKEIGSTSDFVLHFCADQRPIEHVDGRVGRLGRDGSPVSYQQCNHVQAPQF